MKKKDRRSVFAKIRDRFRYNLATQELLDRLSATFGLVIYPYYLVLEQIHPDIKPPTANVDCNIRYLTEEDMELLAEHAARKRSTESLLERICHENRGIGLFIDGDLAAYTWFSLDRASCPVWKDDMFQLAHDEAFLFDMYVLLAYRGRGLAPLIRYRAYEELQSLGRHRLYSITLAFNTSSRLFKQKLRSKEVELRLLIGLKRWKAVDVRLRAFDDQLRTPRWQLLGRLE